MAEKFFLPSARPCATLPRTQPSKRMRTRVLIFPIVLALSCEPAFSDPTSIPMPPEPKKVPHEMTIHGDTRVDPYFWMKERDTEPVLEHLRAEKAYSDAYMIGTEDLQESLYQEIRGRVKERDNSAPYFKDGYWWYTRNEVGKDYGIHCRKKGSLEADEEIVLDENPLAEGLDYFRVGNWEVTEDGRYMLLAIDRAGDRIYDVTFHDLDTGEALPDKIEGITNNLEWTRDGSAVLYASMDKETLRNDRILLHQMGTSQKDDVVLFDETDETFDTSVSSTSSRDYLTISSSSTLTTEVQLLPSNQPTAELTVFCPRERGHEYGLDHDGKVFYIHTNKDAKNFRLMKATGPGGPATWEEIVPHREDVLLEDFELFDHHLVLDGRAGGLKQIIIADKADPMVNPFIVPFRDPAYLVYLAENPEMSSPKLRFVYTSMTTPWATYEIDLRTHEQELLKIQEIPGGYDPELYISERIFAKAEDGTEIPISLVRRRDLEGDLPAPLYLYGYGSYGASLDATFRSSRLTLLDRGFVFAIAHIRGGEEMGRSWYENGRQMQKKNTFTDFLACAEHLIAEGVTSSDRLVASGGSAGGLLVGACLNLRPDLFRTVVADVPFVDVVTTMLDETLPLTAGEWDEWGNPKEEDYYRYMLSYSPYDNVTEQAYPTILVTTGYNDSQVQYWEPAKWVAKLRDQSTSDNPVVFKIEMDVGHAGKSGRFESLREIAYEYAFLLRELSDFVHEKK